MLNKIQRTRLNKIVSDCIRDHTGGEEFFTAFDACVNKDIELINTLLRIVVLNRHYHIICSGKFGLYLSNVLAFQQGEIFGGICLVVNGNLRNGDPVILLNSFQGDIKGANFVFLDDSFYSGKTRDAIKKTLNKLGGDLIHTYVVYDGSKNKDLSVTSLYRYYDNEPILSPANSAFC